MADKYYISLTASEQTLVSAAATIYAAYVTNGRVREGDETSWLKRSIQEAVRIARITDEAIQSDGEFH